MSLYDYIAEGISDEVPTGDIYEFVGTIDATIIVLTEANRKDLASEWLQLRDAIEEREKHNDEHSHPDDDHATDLPDAPVIE